jgi:hypothetical protein
MAIMSLLLLAAAGVSLGPLYERWRAEQLLRLLHQTTVGVTTEAEFRRAATKQLRFTGLNPVEDEARTSDDEFSQSVSNRIGLDKLTPWSMFAAEVAFDKGIVVRKSASIAVGNGAEFAGNVTECLHIPQIGGLVGEELPPPAHHLAGYEYNPWHRFYIIDDVGATEADKRADWHINLACMTKFGGCRDARELFPDARITSPLQWKQD